MVLVDICDVRSWRGEREEDDFGALCRHAETSYTMGPVRSPRRRRKETISETPNLPVALTTAYARL